MKIQNIRLANKKIATSIGILTLDKNGIVDIPADKVEKFIDIGFVALEEMPSTQAEMGVEQVEEETPTVCTNEEEKTVTEENTVDFSKMNVPQLKKYARDNGIDIGDANKKVDILAILQA